MTSTKETPAPIKDACLNPKIRAEIARLQNEATLLEAEAATRNARALVLRSESNEMIYKAVDAGGGIPASDGVCLRCGVMVMAGTSHTCKVAAGNGVS